MPFELPTKDYANAYIGTNLRDLETIHQSSKNIAICQRSIEEFQQEIQLYCQHEVEFKLNGSKDEIIRTFKSYLEHLKLPQGYLVKDVEKLFDVFEELTNSQSYRILFSTIYSDMCRRFHTDFNQLRLLCTYQGPATLWLPDEGANRHAHYNGGNNEAIVRAAAMIQQATAGDVLILKGAAYPNAQAVIHKSPAIQKTGEHRLLLRIDINDKLKF